MALSRWKTPLLLLGSVFILQSILAAEPPKPGEIVVLKVTNSSISLEWGQPSIVDNTLYKFNVTYNSSAEIKTITTETNSTMLNNLMSGTSYNVMVVTIVNNTASVPVVKNIFTAPNPVSNVKVSNHTTTSITLSWKQPFGNRSDYTYKVVLSDNLRTKVTADEVIVFMNLKPGTEYTFSVFTLVAENTSADPVNISTATVPSKPGAIIVTDVSNSSISLSLGNPANMTINQYNFSISYGIASDQIKSSTESTNFTTIQGLQSGTNYTISVTTVIPAGVKSEAVVLSQFTKPNEVQSVAVVTVTTNLIILQWMKPVDHKEGYLYMILTEGNPPPIDNYGNITVEFENATIKNLTSGTSYSFSITTFVADGTRANPVKTLSYTKPVQIPEAHINVSSNGTVNTLFVSWIKPSGNVEMYFIVVEDVKNSSKIIIQSTNITSTVKFPGLRPGRVYNVSVITNSGPFNVTSGNVQGITDPNPPGPITVTNFTNSFISLKWDAPLGMDDGSYTFKITYKNGSAEMFMTVNSRSAIIPNLVSGTNYTICVATIGPGELQSECISTFQFTKPNMVSNIQIVKVDTTSVTLNWTRPIEHKDDYSYLVLAKESLKPGITQNLTVNIESATLTDLTPGINYTFTIITHVANIQADGVEISSYTQPEQIPEANIRVNNNGTVDTLFVSWNKPAGNVEMYFIVVEDVNNLEKKIESTNVTSTVTFPGLRPGRVYNVTVITNSGPFNVTSGNVQGITVPNPPGAISVLSFNTSSISLNWGAPAEMDDGCCSFNITYTNGSTTETANAPTNSTTIQNLISGTEYTIFVATVGPGQLLSRNQSIKHFTKPNPIQNLRILIFSTSSITLEWTKPEEHKAGYKYRVVTEGSPAPTNSNGNKTTMAENVTVDGLTSGTNYSFSVTTLAEDGTPAESVIIANYTEPMKIPSENISLSNENRTDTLNVSWILPPGGVESFTVEIKDRGGDHKANTVGHSVTELVFRDLRPGRLYVVTVTTISGPHYITSDNVSEATLPTPPGSIEVTDVTNSSLQFRWDRPENMDIGEYKFIVSYQTAQPPNSKHFIQETNSSIIYDLASGTKYTITVLTTIHENLNSTIMRTSIYTKPNPVKNVRVSETNSNSINLTWDQPVGYRREYNYTVQTHGNTSSAHVVSDENLLVDGLNSGDNFTFTIITLAADGTRSNPVSLSQCTDAAAISSSSLSCKGVNRRPVLNLMWTCPSGLNTGFTLQAKQNPDVVINGISAACISNKEHQYNLSNVEFSTTYIVSITTLSCGLPSTPVSINCTSGITDPPRPLNTLELLNLDIGHKLIQFNIGRGAFNSTSGPILTVAVIVTKDENENAPNDKDLATAYSSGILTYVTQVINLPTAPQNTRVDAQTDPIRINVGDNSQTMGYLNQELTPLTGYRFSLAGFTKVQYNEEKKIDPNKSLYSTYEYSGMITTKQDPGVIIGAVVGTILGALVIVFLAVLLIWWKKRTKSNNKNLTQLPIPNMRVARNAINVDYFEGYFSKQHADSDCGFAEEYEELKTVGISQSTQVSQQPLNKPKNRYNNVLPYDNSRVKLSVTSDPSSDYINANFMPGYHSKKEFIAAQGPLMNTVSDFWRMIWDQRVPAVVMLTKCVEQGRAKCEQYWPTERPLIFEDKIVTLTSEVIYQDWTIRDFSVVKDKSGEKYHVKQFHFTGWPDHGVPSTTGILIKFRNLVRDYINQHPLSGPTVVHCSAGVGRTGTFISIDNMIQQIDNNRKVDIWGTVYQLRMNRPLMVQTESQYVFLNQCAMEYIKSSKQHTEEAIYENAPALIYENTSAIRAAQASNGHIL